ncbi:hypothetical protein [Natrinema gelatinilyticum]|uniref:hypothetical protein n=1 Tax=Natrinema gelatinilyticum TaxID=2961571 RepID=UPI003CE5020F
MPQLTSAVGLSEGTRRQGAHVTEQAQERGLTNGKHPAGVAAAPLYLVAEARVEGATQAEITEGGPTCRRRRCAHGGRSCVNTSKSTPSELHHALRR